MHIVRQRLFGAAVVLLLLAAAAGAGDMAIGKTGYSLTVPDGFSAQDPGALHLQASSASGEQMVQVLPEIPGEGGLVAVYEARMAASLKQWKVEETADVKVAGADAVRRRYSFSNDGVELEINALFYAAGQTRLILHTIAQPKERQAMVAILMSLKAPADDTPGRHPGTPRPDLTAYPVPRHTRTTRNERKVPGYMLTEVDYFDGDRRVCRDRLYDGKLTERISFSGDVMHGPHLTLNSQGTIRRLAVFAQGKWDGVVLEWSDKGILAEVQTWRQGVKHGRFMRWLRDTTVPYIEETYADGKLDGIQRTWRNGILQEEATLKAGRRHGLYRSFDAAGRPLYEGRYVDGKPDGEHKAWRDGQPAGTTLYRDGQKVQP